MNKVYQVFDRFNGLVASFDNEDAAKKFCDKTSSDSRIEEKDLLLKCPKYIVYKVSFNSERCIDIEALPFSPLESLVDYLDIEDDYYEFYVLAENAKRAKQDGKRKLEKAKKASRS